MSIQLTPAQEQRIHAIVNAGAYRSTEEALDAALSAMEIVNSSVFEGTTEELEGLLMEGLASNELPEVEFRDSVDRETNGMLVAHKPGSGS